MTQSPSHLIPHTIRIAARTRHGQAAAAIKAYLVADGCVTVSAIGPIAVDRAARAISLAGLYLYEESLPGINSQIVGERTLSESGDSVVIMHFHCELR